MRAAQIADLAGNYGTIANQAIWDKVAKYHLDMIVVTVMVWDGQKFVIDPQAYKPETREYVMGRNVAFGFSRVPQWTGLTEVQFAAQLEADLNLYGLDGKRHPRADPCYVWANAELHSFDPVVFQAAFRKTRPTRALGWTIEGGQGGRLLDYVPKLNADSFWTTYGECYEGSMYPQAADFVKDDLRGAGLTRVKLAYDFRLGAPDWMDGIGFTLESLP